MLTRLALQFALLQLASRSCEAGFALYYDHDADAVVSNDNDNNQGGGLRRRTMDRSGTEPKGQDKRELKTAGDFGIRFNKFAFLDVEVADFMPLTAGEYPLSGFKANYLKNHSNAASIVCVGDPAVLPRHIANVSHYIRAIGGEPVMPNSNPTSSFWDEMMEITMLQVGRRSNMNPGTVLRAPDLWAGMDIHAVSDAVHDEYPGILQAHLIEWLWSQNVTLDTDIIPFRSKSDFVGRNVAMASLNTWAIGAVSPFNFYLKWYMGRPRPEEVAFLIAKGNLTARDGVPPDLVQLVKGMNLSTPQSFTAYPEGCPRHPSWPAMHSAASSASFWMAVMLNLTPEQYCEALRVDYAVAFARTCAGVHYASDNIAGLNLGQELMAELLPDHLAETYGSDPDKVRAKIAELRFDWKDFSSFSCTTVPDVSK